MSALEYGEPRSPFPESFDQQDCPFIMLRTFAGQAIRVEHYTEDDDYVVRAYLPGVTPEDVEITVVGEELCIRAESHEWKERGPGPESRHGSFTWYVVLPGTIAADTVKAKYDQAALTVRFSLPETADHEVEQIAVEKQPEEMNVPASSRS